MLSPVAILTAVEEACLGLVGSVETVTPGDLERGAYQSQTAEARAAAARVKPRVEAEWRGHEDSRLTPRLGSHASFAITIGVRIVVPTDFELDADKRRNQRASLALAAEECRAALTRPGNLVETSAGAGTNLVSGCFASASVKTTSEDFKARLLVAEIELKGYACTTRPV